VHPCPDCHGPTWELGDVYERRYRCYLGHVNSAREVLARAAIEVESAMWSAVRALGDRASTLESLAADAHRLGRVQVAELYDQRAKETREQADLARKFMLDLVNGGSEARP
jgi:two-component system chemotaxis response regulator CheB